MVDERAASELQNYLSAWQPKYVEDPLCAEASQELHIPRIPIL